MTHLLDTHAWIQRALGEHLPPLVNQTLTRHAETLAIADISLWEAAKLVELGRLQLSIPLAEFFRLAITPELTVLPITPAIAERVTALEAAGFHKDPADQLIVDGVGAWVTANFGRHAHPSVGRCAAAVANYSPLRIRIPPNSGSRVQSAQSAMVNRGSPDTLSLED